ncbi:MAG: L-seryl-tRNA(Sec) selenium transferase [Candidatus Eremiobacteraeota bacterium]|nr:L-seryl-tRNA(Sec) selenium transferase [Candidatus Eremiobacteraeota bacterium]
MRSLPAVHRLLSNAAIGRYESLLGREWLKTAIGVELDFARAQPDALGREGSTDFGALVGRICERLERVFRRGLVGAINATGVLLHTNLGRAPLAESALKAMQTIGRSYSNLEFDLENGERGSRYARLTTLLRTTTGAQDALVVNNCAAAVLLILDTFAKGREVIVSRNQLIEIGGGFRLPDVLERSGANLVEVGATNKVYLKDFERALSPRTTLLLRSHPSNYRITGFTHDVDPTEFAALAKRVGIPSVEDLGSGALIDLAQFGLPHERTVQEAVRDGIDLITFSGDKLLGGPQAGIILGTTPLIARLRNNPLLRALRVDKLTIAALSETLRLYATGEALHEIPFYRMLSTSLDDLRTRGDRYFAALNDTPCRAEPTPCHAEPTPCHAELVEASAYVGGGTLPEVTIPSIAISVSGMNASALAAKLRANDPPIVARIDDGRLLLDLRTIAPREDEAVIAALNNSFTSSPDL